ncbi:MAG: PHP domain-containing protein, partial [Oscillospiraceae bacterium]
MKLFYDLHMHSCLSPCGGDDMSPANLAAMCALAGLQVVALTDHNSVGNCRSFCAAAQARGLLALPGMELSTVE